eukprot:Selendium_serpulae@DN4992_c0_g1_i2.p1
MTAKVPGPSPGHFLFTSESVNEGHPDKLCDLISDSILDACLSQDAQSRVDCEVCTKTGLIMIFGDIRTDAKVDYTQLARECCEKIGYDDDSKGLDYKNVKVMVSVEEKSNDTQEPVDDETRSCPPMFFVSHTAYQNGIFLVF